MNFWIVRYQYIKEKDLKIEEEGETIGIIFAKKLKQKINGNIK